ncbi:hypothetical protein [Streptomyces albus]|uniref:hypothetical protein n=1 Tax=Streptomyces albus TaxID=1888 RepID=UPI0033CE7E72
MVWGTAVVSAVAAVGLAAVAWLGNLDTAGQAASVVGAVVGLAGLVVSVFTLARPANGGAAVGTRVRAGQGSVAAGGDISGSAVGAGSQVVGPPSPSPAPSPAPGNPPAGGSDVRARRDGVAAGRNITDSALGDNSHRTTAADDGGPDSGHRPAGDGPGQGGDA